MRKTLDENGVKDDTPEFDQVTPPPPPPPPPTPIATPIPCLDPDARLP